MSRLDRRDVLRGGAALAAALAPLPALAVPSTGTRRAPVLRYACKIGMVAVEGSLTDRFRLLADLGYDGVELDSPSQLDPREVLAAREATGLPVHGVVDSIHWQVRLSDPDPEVRARGVEGLGTAIRDAHAHGGSSVLLVPGRVADPERENQQQVFERSIEGIRAVLPLAAELGIHVLIENVWNGFCYEHGGPADQTADELARYLDTIASPWVGSYFDIGNHQKYGRPADWIRTLGPRIVKLDVKDWGIEPGFCRIGDGDVDWPDVRTALGEIGYHGWATAEVAGGDGERLADVLARMKRHLGGEEG